MLILTKSHVAGYTRRDGTRVAAHDRRPAYVSRKVLNADEVHSWAVASGFKHVVPPDKMHVTVAYSRSPVHHESLAPDLGTVLADPSHVGLLGEPATDHVLHLDHPHLHARFAHMIAQGASWDYNSGIHPSYSPHLTISYEAQPTPAGVTPFRGLVHLGPEVVEDLKSGWGAALKEETGMAKSLDFGVLTLFKSRVGAYMRNGKLVNLAGYQGRSARAKPAPGQLALFPAPGPGTDKPNPFKGKDPVLDTPDFFDGKTPREKAAGVRVSETSNLLDGSMVRDGNGRSYRVHYQRNGLVLTHPVVDGKPQVSADTTVRFWVDAARSPSGDNDRTDPIYAVGALT